MGCEAKEAVTDVGDAVARWIGDATHCLSRGDVQDGGFDASFGRELL
jgi:hypothetical protein